MDKTISPIKKAIEAAGGARRLADEIGVHPSLVSQWATDRRPMAARHAIPVEKATGGAVTRHELCPDVFGPAPDTTEEVRDAA